MEFQDLLYTKEEGLVTITINRPQKMNALSLVTWSELEKALREAESDPEVKVIVITGAGDRAFCAGDDIGDFAEFNVSSARAYAKSVVPKFFLLEKCDKPVIAAVNGLAMGGGLELTLASDITIASEKATFAVPEPRIGAYAAFAVLRLPQVVGVKRAKQLLLTCDTIDAREAERIGLVNKVVPADQLKSAVKEVANKIMHIAPLSAALSKAAVNRSMGGEEVEYSIAALTGLLSSDDCKEGYDAFMHKRRPVFKGK